MSTKIKKSNRNKTKPRFKPLPTGPTGHVELLLIHSVEDLGAQGEVVEVRRGYASNYLIPQGLATFATDHHKRMVDKHKVKLQALERARLAGLREEANEISKQSVTIEARATNEGHLYGSVGATEIAAALKNVDITVSPEHVKLEGPLKELGLYTVKIRLASEVEAELKVWVVPSAGQEVEAAS
jgi:large subunit ribosomal protein L9